MACIRYAISQRMMVSWEINSRKINTIKQLLCTSFTQKMPIVIKISA